MTRKKKKWQILSRFQRLEAAVVCVGIMKRMDLSAHVEPSPDKGNYVVLVGTPKIKKEALELLERLNVDTLYTFELIEKSN